MSGRSVVGWLSANGPVWEPRIAFNWVVYVAGTDSVFGPFATRVHARLWACRGAGGLEYQVLKFKNLLAQEKKS